MRALCIGSATVDIIVLVRSGDVERMTMHNATSSFLLLEQGRKFDAQSITRHIGGGAVNAAVAISRLGVDTAVLVKIGEDENGDAILARLADENVAAEHVLRTGELPTGETVMVSSHDRNATIFTQRGANTALRPDDIEPGMFAAGDLVYISNLSNRSVECFAPLVAAAKAASAFVAVNPGIRQITSRAPEVLANLAHIDLVIMNRVEAEALVPALVASGDGTVPAADDDPAASQDLHLARLGLSFGGFTMDLAEFNRRLRATGVAHVAITDGTYGAYLSDRSGLRHCPSLEVEVMGTAGAGDAFAATLSSYLAGGAGPDAALQAATANASSVVAQIDTQSGLKSRAALDALIAGSADKLVVRRC